MLLFGAAAAKLHVGMAKHWMKSLVVGMSRRWRTALTQALGIIGTVWLITEILTRVSSEANAWVTSHGDAYLGIVLAAGSIWFLAYIYEQRKVRFQVPTTDSHITVVFGDLFDVQADWLIGVNEFFDGQLGQVVAPTSVHGQFISKVFNGDAGRFRDAVEAALAGSPSTPAVRPGLPPNRYDVGTTAVIANGPRHVFLVAMARTNLATAKASSSVPLLWDAMRGGLQAVQDYGNGAPLAMPLLGNGRSSVNVEPQHLLRLLVLALVDFGRKVGLPKDVIVVVPDACFDLLDLREIRRDWMKQ